MILNIRTLSKCIHSSTLNSTEDRSALPPTAPDQATTCSQSLQGNHVSLPTSPNRLQGLWNDVRPSNSIKIQKLRVNWGSVAVVADPRCRGWFPTKTRYGGGELHLLLP
jgi:hypothetical protein